MFTEREEEKIEVEEGEKVTKKPTKENWINIEKNQSRENSSLPQ